MLIFFFLQNTVFVFAKMLCRSEQYRTPLSLPWLSRILALSNRKVHSLEFGHGHRRYIERAGGWDTAVFRCGWNAYKAF